MAIREQAAKIPGYGQPDIFYPPYFQGSWQVERTCVGVVEGGTQTLSTEDAAIIRSIMEEAEALQNKPVAFKARFFFHRGKLISDRAFNTFGFERAKATILSTSEPVEPQWDPDNPNILTIGFASGLLREVKVTKRAVEDNSGNVQSFGYSEFQRIADTNTAGPQSSVPKLAAARILTRYRVVDTTSIPSSTAGVPEIEGLELQKFCPPVSLKSDPAPLLTIKTRVRLLR